MPVWRATLFFEYGRYSWSESFHYADQGSIASQVLADAKALARASLNLMGRNETVDSSPRIPYIRVSDDNTLRDAFIINDLADQVSNIALLPPTPSEPWDCLEIRCQVENRIRRKIFYVSCIPATLYTDPRGPLNPGAGGWIDAFNVWRNLLTKKWGLNYRVTQADDLPRYQVINMIRTDQFVELPGVPLPLGGQRISLNRGNYGLTSPILRGLFYTAPSQTAFARVIVPGLTRDITYTDGATAQLVRYVVQPLKDVSIVKKTHHKRGVESGLVHRGRRLLRR